MKEGVAELKERATGEEQKIPLENVVKAVEEFLNANA